MNDYAPQREIVEVNYGRDLILPSGMRPLTTVRHSLIRYQRDSLSFRAVRLPGGVRFCDARQLFEKTDRVSIGAPNEHREITAPLVFAQHLMVNQNKIPKRVQGRIIVFTESFLVDFTGKQYIRTLEYNQHKKCWEPGIIEAFGAAFYPEYFVIPYCKLFFGRVIKDTQN